jgi:hypothetical protein
MLGLDSREAVECQQGWYKNDERYNRICSKWHRNFCQSTHALGQGARAGLFIVGV